MVICPQVLQAGASLCMLLAAAFRASKLFSARYAGAGAGFLGVFAGWDGGFPVPWLPAGEGPPDDKGIPAGEGVPDDKGVPACGEAPAA
jgi:hypothetical protein